MVFVINALTFPVIDVSGDQSIKRKLKDIRYEADKRRNDKNVISNIKSYF